MISCAIAIPVAWYFMNEWLKNYDYKISIGFGVFVLSCSVIYCNYINNGKFPGDKSGDLESGEEPSNRMRPTKSPGGGLGESSNEIANEYFEKVLT